VRVLLVDDHELFRTGMRYLLRDMHGDIEITEAGALEEVEPLADHREFDLILLDYHLPAVTGLDSLIQVRAWFVAPPIVIVSGDVDPVVINQAIRQGAAGFVPKSSSKQVLAAALKLVLAGTVYLPPEILETQDEGESSVAHDPLQSLSARQREVLMKAIQGKANKVIARELDITDHTVKAHLAVAYRLLNVRNRSEAVYAVARLGVA